MIDSINILNTENRGLGTPLWSLHAIEFFTGFIATLANILTDSSETDAIVKTLITHSIWRKVVVSIFCMLNINYYTFIVTLC